MRHNPRDLDDQCVQAVVNATDCSRGYARDALRHHPFVPDAIAWIEERQSLAQAQAQADADPTSLAQALARIEALEFDVERLKDAVNQLSQGTNP